MPKARSKARMRPAPSKSSSPAKSRRIAAKRVAKKPVPARKSRSSKGRRPIELYFWPTSNGLKISIMLEECGLPYELKPVNINRGEQFAPQSGRQADRDFRIRRHSAISRAQDRQVLSQGRTPPGRG